jgi:hypothetical protein
MAREWLKQNHTNRPLRPNVVNNLHEAYGRGEWKVTHQGIAFASSGRLLDGQHRLTFISQLPEGSQVALNVTHDQDENTFDAIDIGVNRSMGDVYGISTEFIGVGRFFAKIANSSSTAGLTNQSVKPFVDWSTPELEELLTFCPTKKKMWSSVPVRAAAVYQLKRGHDSDFVKIAYHSLVTSDVGSMPFAAQALMKQYITGRIVSARSLDLFCRALRAFDSTNNKRIASIIVQDTAPILGKVRDFIEGDMKKSPVFAGLKVAKPSAKFNWNKAA